MVWSINVFTSSGLNANCIISLLILLIFSSFYFSLARTTQEFTQVDMREVSKTSCSLIERSRWQWIVYLPKILPGKFDLVPKEEVNRPLALVTKSGNNILILFISQQNVVTVSRKAFPGPKGKRQTESFNPAFCNQTISFTRPHVFFGTKKREHTLLFSLKLIINIIKSLYYSLSEKQWTEEHSGEGQIGKIAPQHTHKHTKYVG